MFDAAGKNGSHIAIIHHIHMTYRGHIKNGAVVLDEPQQLPEGAAVEIAVHSPAEPSGSTFYDRFADLIGSCPDLPPDMAKNHDHYLHGREKK